MAFGGGSFTSQNKKLPGAYINFVSVKNADAQLSDRGIAAFAGVFDWADAGEVKEITRAEFMTGSLSVLGYPYGNAALMPFRELFCRCNKVIAVNAVNAANGGVKASGVIGTAAKAGIAGNNIEVAVTEEGIGFSVVTKMYGVVSDTQVVSEMSELVDNDFVHWNESFELDEGNFLFSGGSNGSVTDYSGAFDVLQNYSFNVLVTDSISEEVQDLAYKYTVSMRDDYGMKFQTVLFEKDCGGGHEGIINVCDFPSAVYWVAGACAGCAVNKPLLNTAYDGELAINPVHTQAELAELLGNGYFAFHKVGSDARVLSDINSLTEVTETKGVAFKENQTIRVIDQIANDTAVLFSTKYMGFVANDKAGRTSFWADMVALHNQLMTLRAIENFVDTDIAVTAGAEKGSVVINERVCPVNAMAKLYMDCVVE
jgi:hypothetical protein